MGGGGVQRVVKFLKYWDYDRFVVSVITVNPSYFYAEDKSLYTELPPYIRVHRTGTLDPFRLFYFLKKFFSFFKPKREERSKESSSFFRNVANAVFLPDSRILWFPFAFLKLVKIHRRYPIHMVIASMPPFTTGIIARAFQFYFNVPYVLDFRDAWTNNPYIPTVSFLHEKIQNRLEKKTVNDSRGIVFVNPRLRNYYRNKYLFPERMNETVVRNGYDPADFRSGDYLVENRNELFRIGIMGTVYSHGNAPLTLLEALEVLRNEKSDIAGKIGIMFIGKWTGEFLSVIEKSSIRDHIEFVDYVPHRKALEWCRDFDVLALAVQSNRKGSVSVTPGRIYEYLFLQKPVLAMCPPESDLAQLVKSCDAGEVVDYEDVQGIADILTDWVKNRASLSERYTYTGLEEFDRRHLTRQMMQFLLKCLREK